MATGETSWRLQVPTGPDGVYRWAQLDDYMELRRGKFPWQPPTRMELRARVSEQEYPGTWGFGYWNDPFSASFNLGGMARRTPTLPQAAWFFYASPPNYLSLRDDLPAQGLLAATFQSPKYSRLLLPFGALAVPGLALNATRKLLRRVARVFIKQDTARVDIDVTDWHTYTLEWNAGQVKFEVDGGVVLTTLVAPRGPLGFVLWIDNQYAAFTPEGNLSFGTLSNPQPAWMEIQF